MMMDSVCNMSKADTLRGFVTERLAAASREISAVVDRIVAEYEEEASGLRLEVDRQRVQLEVLLQPRVTLHKQDVKHSCRSRRGDEEEEDEDLSPSGSDPVPDQLKKRRPGRPQDRVDLRIRILDDPKTKVLSNRVLEKCPELTLAVPRGLKGGGLLDLLRSSFPQLQGENQQFDMLTWDKKKGRRSVKRLTPQEVDRYMSCTRSQTTPLFIRLKTRQEPETSEDHLSPAAMLASNKSSRPTSSRVEASSSSTPLQHDVDTEHAHDDGGEMGAEVDEDLVACSADNSTDDQTEKEDKRAPNASDGEFKESDSDLRSKQRRRRCGVKATGKRAQRSCKVCGAFQKSEATLIKHAWSHVEDGRSLCGVCAELLACEAALKEHLLSEHRTDDCHICGEAFLSLLSLNEHVAAHSGDRPYPCGVCPETFALKVTLENHSKRHEARKKHKCHTCNKVFEGRSQLKAHRSSHTHLCGVCGKSLSDYRSLSRHKLTHSGERPHACQVCGRSFKLPGTLRQHEKIHTDRERSFLCDVCCKMFLTSKQLLVHMRTHNGEKPFHCGQCGKGFTTKGPLTVHMRVHTGETPYRCPHCGWSFKRKVHLDNHVTVHSDLKPFVCGICGKACARKVYLKVHMRTHNGERPYKCTLCDKAFTQSHCLKTHMRSHGVPHAAP